MTHILRALKPSFFTVLGSKGAWMLWVWEAQKEIIQIVRKDHFYTILNLAIQSPSENGNET